MARHISQVAPSRRTFLKAGGGLLAMTVMPSGQIVGRAWAQMPRSTKPETFATLVQMSRDIYPHDQIEDAYYAKAVGILDEAARASEAELALLEDGVAALDQAARDKAGVAYGEVPAEEERVALLKAIEGEPFFQKVRSNLVVGLYNQKELWPIFGYEGASADKGGYIDRGFDDIAWL
ncbi:Tat (Twin-arginine translocation) pathway signal sequence domain protein [Lutibaculum baratangense]|uniref:Tat (Twin-arginine translocation) pathway signal sequence domain protein n=1 Tax=Lutibaculum baratangense AMV1 TaxID=631454 RepID=V4R4F0_9HYPH|nr:Tat (Twin-arginine translocation) pathway signal sequence domain protein [Lutibaculum baratangense]ESR26832.1 Tat (Twin-arginine translocation) pathway signal sequence domain protein [Lutibaculum baratangense AMV1]